MGYWRDVQPTFETEAALCQAFICSVPPEWIVYPETAGWDILLVHRIGGWQIGIEAKKTLNAKVIAQAIEGRRHNLSGPDFRAVLVGKVVAENAAIARALGITVITPKGISQWGRPKGRGFDLPGPLVPVFTPEPPRAEVLTRIGEWWSNWDEGQQWFDQFPTDRNRLPDYIPEVAAGVPSPMILSDWKIKAMRVCQWVDRHGVITRAQFKALGIDPSRWMNGHWLKAAPGRGEWCAGEGFPGPQFRREHPGVWAKIAEDYPKWAAKVTGTTPEQEKA